MFSSMSDFQEHLKTAIALPPYSGNQRRFAKACGVDVAHLNRVLAGQFSPSPAFVGRIIASIQPRVGAVLLKAFLDSFAQAALTESRPKNHEGKWANPSSRYRVAIDVTHTMSAD